MDRRTVGWLLVFVQFAMLVVLLLLPWRSPSILSVVTGVALVAAGAVLGVRASQRLGRALTPTPVPIDGAGLRTTGAYERVRHPIYSAVLMGVLGFTIAIGSWWTLAWAGLILVFFLLKSRWEDRLLHAEYGAEWLTWARRTGSIIPGIGTRRDA